MSSRSETVRKRAIAGAGRAPGAQIQPRWDRRRRILRVGSVAVKQFQRTAPNQEAILDAFQAQGWPQRIDDPLSPVPDIVPAQRLHDAIKQLNRTMEPKLIRFCGDGAGRGVLWRLV